MATRNVVLTAYHDRVINRLVKSGKYQNASEVLREGVRLVAQREAEDAARVDALRKEIQKGIDAHARGEFIALQSGADIDRFFDDVIARGRVRHAPRKAS